MLRAALAALSGGIEACSPTPLSRGIFFQFCPKASAQRNEVYKTFIERCRYAGPGLRRQHCRRHADARLTIIASAESIHADDEPPWGAVPMPSRGQRNSIVAPVAPASTD